MDRLRAVALGNEYFARTVYLTVCVCVSVVCAGSGNVDELMVVSLVVASRGSFSVPTVRSASDLKAVLKRLGGLVADELMAVEVTWSPQVRCVRVAEQWLFGTISGANVHCWAATQHLCVLREHVWVVGLAGNSCVCVCVCVCAMFPQAEGDSLTRDEVLADYPDLTPL